RASALLRGEEWLEDVSLCLEAHSDARVSYLEKHVGAGRQIGVSLETALNFGIRRANQQLSSIGHGVTGIHNQIHNDLLHLTGIGLDAPELRIQKSLELNVFT